MSADGCRQPGRVCRWLACFSLLAASVAATGADLVVRDIRVEGLQRISEGTVFNYLPVNIGDTLDAQHSQEALRAVYATGFFTDVELRWDNGTLVIAVAERPSIESFSITGNKDIKTEDLTESLSKIGLRAGRTFNRSVLDEVEQSLTDQYFSRGKYAARVDTEVEDLPDNKVRIAIKIVEGDRARIRQINIVGNHSFSDEEVLEGFQLKMPNWLSFIRQDDRYSREALQGDLETLRSFYMDQGFADFRIESTQVALSPDKKDIFVTVNLVEGERYKVADVKLAGNLILPEEELNPYVLVKPGQIYSQRTITQSADLVRLRLGEEGYAFANVEPVPELDKVAKTAAITLYVEPKNRVYVRRVNFNGTTSINDEVLRREVRQFEGGYLSNSRLERSKIRLQRLPYIEQVESSTNPVPGSADLVDIDFDIKEGLPGQFGGGIGYSGAQGVLLNANLVHTNFFGTGERVSADVSTSHYRTIYSLSHRNPYTTIDEVSRTISMSYRDITQYTSGASNFSTETGAISVEYSYPITEFQQLIFGFSWQESNLLADTYSSAQAREWVQRNGSGFAEKLNGGAEIYGTNFSSIDLVAGWMYDSRNRVLFADSGARHRLMFSTTVPGSDVEYYTVNYTGTQYFPMGKYFTLSVNLDLGYGDSFGDTTAIVPFKNFFAGGPDSVRGFRDNYLGPRDSYGNPYGGNLMVAAQTELILPIPEKWRSRSRLTLFYDAGNVFSTSGVNFTAPYPNNTIPIDYDFSFSELKQSVGISAQWLAPLGLFRFSYGFPLNADKRSAFSYGDDTERFQFSIGGAF
ncbi:MAG: outer membrane protein assembly factor BamA [Gammaproteobacteria bacterium]|nr:outer membrane protein assembly factor BamA [Gammaproteobacteria bacterium]